MPGKGRIQASAEGRASGLLPSGASQALGHPGACELLAAEGPSRGAGGACGRDSGRSWRGTTETVKGPQAELQRSVGCKLSRPLRPLSPGASARSRAPAWAVIGWTLRPGRPRHRGTSLLQVQASWPEASALRPPGPSACSGQLSRHVQLAFTAACCSFELDFFEKSRGH